MVKGTCRNRAESAAMDDLSRSLVLVNYFRDLPAFPEACKDNSAPLMDALAACQVREPLGQLHRRRLLQGQFGDAPVVGAASVSS